MDKKLIEKSFSNFSKSTSLAGYASKISSNLLESLGDTQVEAQEAVAAATVQIWAKLENGKLVVPEDLKSPDAFWMSLFKKHIRHYLLKRYARRTNRKSNSVYQKELEGIAEGAPKPARHHGGRFEGVDEKPLIDHAWAQNPEDASLFSDEDLRKQFLALGFDADVVDVILLRSCGLTWAEVGHELGEKADTVRIRLARSREKVNIDPETLF